MISCAQNYKDVVLERCSKNTVAGFHIKALRIPGRITFAMSVDATRDATRSFYDGHGHPFLSIWRVEGWLGRPGKERRSGSICS